MGWIHRLFNPHCPDCANERRESHHCESCDTLRTQLEIANFEKKQLLDSLLNDKPKEDIEYKVPQEIIRPKNIPWRVRQQLLEEEDRHKAKLMKDKLNEISNSKILNNKEIDKLEEEIGLDDMKRGVS